MVDKGSCFYLYIVSSAASFQQHMKIAGGYQSLAVYN